MILFSPAKVNLGLRITERRKDGFHNLQSVMLPVGLKDILEFRISPEKSQPFSMSQSGLSTDTPRKSILCWRAWELFSKEITLPPVEMHLHKQIPVGAGLGGGSSNAALTLKGLNLLSGNQIGREGLQEMAAELGSDCSFFLEGGPVYMEGRGEILSPLGFRLEPLYLIILFPGIHISTSKAYRGVTPQQPEIPLLAQLKNPLSAWQNTILNDFESSLFKEYSLLSKLKSEIYRSGASYASLSGSGSALYGIYTSVPQLSERLSKYLVWQGWLSDVTD
jgi:4-diphosphocytidyl-2-C-methyl-D-erythritol kinase